jgi:hypothetical protein
MMVTSSPPTPPEAPSFCGVAGRLRLLEEVLVPFPLLLLMWLLALACSDAVARGIDVFSSSAPAAIAVPLPFSGNGPGPNTLRNLATFLALHLICMEGAKESIE